jgi:hypothetical protein
MSAPEGAVFPPLSGISAGTPLSWMTAGCCDPVFLDANLHAQG